MEATTTGQVDQLWTNEKCSSHSWPLLGKVKTVGQGCGLHASSGGSLECQLKPYGTFLSCYNGLINLVLVLHIVEDKLMELVRGGYVINGATGSIYFCLKISHSDQTNVGTP